MVSRGALAATLTSIGAIAASGCGSSTDSQSGAAGTRSSASPAGGELGISGSDVDANFRIVAKQLGRKVPPHGVIVDRFIGHPPAQAAGLKDASAHQNSTQDSDIIETMDGQPVTAQQLNGPLPGRHAGDVVTLRIWSAQGPPHDVKVTLAAVPKTSQSGGYFPGG